MTATVDTPLRPRPKLSQAEFIALTGMLFASVAFSIDAMLPALPEITRELTPDAPNRAQLIIAAFVLGMGLGTFVTGPLSDSFGRKPVILGGAALYISGALIAWSGPSLEAVLLGRVLQGLGAAGPRVVALAIVRDLYEGRQMARIVSFAMMIFTLFPAVAPLIGSAIIAGFGWRAIFLAFFAFSLVSVGWLTLRQEETLPRPARRPFRIGALISATVEVVTHRVVFLSIVVQSFVFALLFATIATVQPVFDITYGRNADFPWIFATIALVSALPSLINAAIVVRFGMRRLIRGALLSQVIFAALAWALLSSEVLGPGAGFPVYVAWIVTIFGMVGFVIGNLNALAMQPMGHIAGTAASVMGAIATLAGGALGAGLGQAFDGTAAPQALGALVFSALALGIFRLVPDAEGR
jgi:DHA1 family bicyclomycin/chloramphenicol resistance-like MFS transporter